jgi:hypothetical protein
MKSNDTRQTRSLPWWTTPASAFVIGVAYLVAGWIGGDRAFAVGGFALMSAIGVVILIARRYSETVAGLLDRSDERINWIDNRATTITGMTLITAIIVGFVVEIARGQDGSPYSMLGAIGGVTYVVALAFLRLRR